MNLSARCSGIFATLLLVAAAPAAPSQAGARRSWRAEPSHFPRKLGEEAAQVVRFDAISFILGLGYVMGLRASTLLCAGGFLANFVLVPLIWMIGSNAPDLVVYPGTAPIATMDAATIFRSYVRFIGVGAIACAYLWFGSVRRGKR